jgi:hypothetical protein
MRKPAPPGRSSIPPPSQASLDYVRSCFEERFSPPPAFTKHKELASFLAADSAKIFLTFISFSLARSKSNVKITGAKAVLRELNSRLPNHLNSIFAELSPGSRGTVFLLRKKIAHHSARLIASKHSPNTENLEKAILLAQTAGKNAEGRGATPAEISLIVCGVFAASAKVFQSQKERAEFDFIKLTEKISLEMSSQTLISFLWKIADLKNSQEISITIAEILRLQGNEKKIISLLSE